MSLALGGNFYVSFETAADKIEPAIAAVVEELNGLAKSPPTPGELSRARALTGRSFLLGQESAEGLNGLIASFELQKGDYRLKDAYLARWAQLSPDDLAALAATVFKPEGLTVAMILPTGAEKPTPESLTKIFQGLDLTAPASRAQGEANFESHRLDNGLEVLLLRDASLPQVAVKAVARGGLLAEGPGQAGLSNVFAEVWSKATAKLEAPELAQVVEGLGASFDGFSARNSFGLSGSFLSANLDRGLDLFVDLIIEPAFPQASLDEARAEALAAIKAQEERMPERAFRLVRGGLYGSHPYSRDNLGSAEDVAKISVADLKAFHASLARPESLLVAVAGDVDPPAVLAALNERLGAWRPDGAQRAVPIPDPPAPLKQTGFGLDRVDRAQCHLAVGFLAPGLGDPDQAPLEVLNAYLSGMGGVLFQELRDRQSLAYVVASGYNPGLKIGTFFFYIATDPAKAPQAVSGALEILGQTRAAEIDPKDLAAAKSYILGANKIAKQTLNRRVEESVFNQLLGLGLDFESRHEEAIKAVTAADLLRVAKKHLDPGQAFFAAAGQGQAAEKAFEAVEAVEAQPSPPKGPAQ
jgi:zinc protease